MLFTAVTSEKRAPSPPRVREVMRCVCRARVARWRHFVSLTLKEYDVICTWVKRIEHCHLGTLCRASIAATVTATARPPTTSEHEKAREIEAPRGRVQWDVLHPRPPIAASASEKDYVERWLGSRMWVSLVRFKVWALMTGAWTFPSPHPSRRTKASVQRLRASALRAEHVPPSLGLRVFCS